MISVLQLGRIDYAAGLRAQQELVSRRKAGLIGDVLLLLEHMPVITLGRNAKAANVLMPAEQLALRGVDVCECDRGGDVTFHGPGQLVGYPIFDLGGYATPDGKRKTLGAIDYVRRLEEVLIRTCTDFAIPAKRVAGLTGVWTDPDSVDPHLRPGLGGSETGRCTATTTTESKIAAIGVHISRSVTSHGFALNVNADLSYFDLIVPCGITSKPVTSMQRELGRKLDLAAVSESVSRHFGVVFSSQMLWVESLDALLGNTIGVPMKAPGELREMHKDETFWA